MIAYHFNKGQYLLYLHTPNTQLCLILSIIKIIIRIALIHFDKDDSKLQHTL